MDLQIILLLSIGFQLTAVVLALRLSHETGWRPAWLLLASAVGLMALRRLLVLMQWVQGGTFTGLDQTTELVGLAVSMLLAGGLAGIQPIFRAMRESEESLRLNESRLEALWRLSRMTQATLQEISDYTLEAGVSLTRSRLGFLGFLSDDEALMTVQSWSREVLEACRVHNAPQVYPLGEAGLWGEAVRQRQSLIINDYEAYRNGKKGLPPGHAEIRRLLLIPVLDDHRVVALAGVANKGQPYDEADERQLTLLLNGMWTLIKRQRREAALSAEIERMHEFQEKLIMTSSDGIIANDRDGNILIFNAGAEKIMGYSREEVVGKINVRDIYPPGEAKRVKKAIYSPDYGGPGRLVAYETVVLNKNGEEVPIELSASLIFEDDQEVGTVGFFRDLRERRALQQKVLQAERLAVLGRMSAHISHEIKTPLMLIGGFARQVRDHLGEDPEKNRQKLDLIVAEIKRLEDFLVEVGGYTKFSEPHKVPGDLNALIQETVHLLEPSLQEHHIRLELDLDPGVGEVLFDPSHLRQVLLNLLKNSLEAMEDGGRLSVSSRTVNGWVRVEVVDTGRGIPPEDMEKLFQPFFTTKPKGSGLGLAICQRIMQAHQGEITLTSTPGQGTRVRLTLPRSQPV
ncbi:MAG: GAF domain-containing protein [Syntrophobacterales bacterium]|nr:GAF domain-containing protein [Syntrophobacterales bacterium]